jgi:glucose-1-phosphate cytidylyltransferase
MIKEWFADYFLYTSDVTFDFTQGDKIILHNQRTEPWKVTVVDTGYGTMTGGRLKRVQKYIGDEPFMVTYGDGVCDVNISKLLEFHQKHGKSATLTAVKIDQSKGVLDVGGDNAVRSFREKSTTDGALINAGYMVFQPEVFNYLTDDNCILEQEPMQKLASDGQLMSYQHEGFWQCMDTKREKNILEELWDTGKAPWKVW